ncbi:hypothetical protein OUZ56_019678 [Daphnia magna]|uniref:Uncharacterized protein n=1 Tax=Daphnia magna TaxID=35525 RepID=A0ABQ9ZC94_9CRUS|nr:hypothetical protein OUZ56_019678 [Daphnia magna]
MVGFAVSGIEFVTGVCVYYTRHTLARTLGGLVPSLYKNSLTLYNAPRRDVTNTTSYQINAAAALPFNPTAKMRFGILKIGVLLKGGGAGLSHGTGV